MTSQPTENKLEIASLLFYRLRNPRTNETSPAMTPLQHAATELPDGWVWQRRNGERGEFVDLDCQGALEPEDSCARYVRGLDEKDRDFMERNGMIVQCPVCGCDEACNSEVAEAFGLPEGMHGAAHDNRCATTGIMYGSADSPMTHWEVES